VLGEVFFEIWAEYHSRDSLFCATDFEGVGLICRLWGRLSLQVREKIGKFLGN
jgi:hypothetical protein